MQSKKGLFLTFEGIDGAGKSSQLELLKKDLEQQKVAYVLLREPGGTSISEQIRTVLLSHENQEMTSETELLLFAAARAQLVEQIVKPALDQNKIVISDRFFDSTTAYQGFGREMDVGFIKYLNEFATRNLQPDLTFYFDLTVDKALQRLGKRVEKADRIDQESRDFMERTRAGYLQIAQWYPERVKLINADRPIAAIYADLKQYLKEYIDLEA